jgi:hypothetical protein
MMLSVRKHNECTSPTVITVKQDGTGVFTTITAAIASITDASSTHPYEIVIYPGVYREISIRMKNNVSLRGTDKEVCIIQGELPDSLSDELMTPISTIDWITTGYIKDLTITCRNMRYPIHSDGGAYGNKDGRQEIYNCYLEHHGNQGVVKYRADHGLPPGSVWNSLHAWGCGTSDGMVVIAKDTTFVSSTTAFYFHENRCFDKPSYLELSNCKMIATNEDGCAILIQGYGSGRNGKLVVNNCEVIGFTDMDVGSYLPESQALTYFRNTECTIVGGGNTLSPVRVYTTTQTLRITSQSVEAVSTVRLSGTAVTPLFGDPTYNDGAGRIRGYVEGNTDIASTNPNTPLTSLGNRLGDRTAAPWTLEISIDGGIPVTVAFNQDYLLLTNPQIISIIQQAIGSSGEVVQLGVGLDYYPEYVDQIIHLNNTSTSGILKGMALAYNTSFKNCRKLTNTDEAEDFVGIALEDIKPGHRGKILIKGIVFDAPGGKLAGNGNHGILQHAYEAAVKGDKFGISSQPGYMEKGGSPVIARSIAPHLIHFGGK